MSKNITAILFGILFSDFLFADGPPMDSTGKIRAKYIAIKLEANQVNHLQVCRWLKLTSVQQKKLHFLNLPEYIDILDPFYRDCTCGMIYAMWFRVDSIAFVISDTTKMVKYYEEGDEICTRYGKKFNKAHEKNEILIGTTGQLFYMGKLIDFDAIAQIIKEFKPKEGEDKYFFIYRPPITNNPNAKAVIKMQNKLRNSKFEKCYIYWS